jgi:hypothetical protein
MNTLSSPGACGTRWFASVARLVFGAMLLGAVGAMLAPAQASAQTPPRVIRNSVPPDGTYYLGQSLNFVVQYSEPVFVTGTPGVWLKVGPNSGPNEDHFRVALIASGSGTDTLTFTYTVTSRDVDTDGLSHLSMEMDNGAAIRSASGVNAEWPTWYNSVVYYVGTHVFMDGTQPPPNGTTAQALTFNSPTSNVAVGVPITLGATSSSGLPITYSVVSGNATIDGILLTPQTVQPLVVRASAPASSTFAAATTDVNFGTPRKGVQAIIGELNTRIVTSGATIALPVHTTAGLPVQYTVSGPATISGNQLKITGSYGTVYAYASQAGDANYNPAGGRSLVFSITSTPLARLVNISSRLHVSGDDPNGAAIAGFVVTGTVPRQYLIRAAGPTLSYFGVTNPLSDPQLKLFDAQGALVATNAGWANDPMVSYLGDALGAFRFTDGSVDAALLLTLAPGSYTAQVSSSSGGTGTALLEVYDGDSIATSPTKQLINISTRGVVGPGDDVLIGGFVISGDRPKRLLIRAVGPGLNQFGVVGTLSDPVLTVYDTKRVVVARNQNWGTGDPVTNSQYVATPEEIDVASSASGAFPLQRGSLDAALIVTLPPGAYSAVVTAGPLTQGLTNNDTRGAALVEIYEIAE